MSRIRYATLIVHGDADTVVDPRNAGLLAGRIRGARLVTFPGLGHLLFWEDPVGFADTVASFLLADGGKRAKGSSRHGPFGINTLVTHASRGYGRQLS